MNEEHMASVNLTSLDGSGFCGGGCRGLGRTGAFKRASCRRATILRSSRLFELDTTEQHNIEMIACISGVYYYMFMQLSLCICNTLNTQCTRTATFL